MSVREKYMRLEKAEKQYLEKIVEISMEAFETDIEVGGTPGDYPPDYNSISWHEQMRKEGHLFQAIEDDKVIGGAVLFLGDNKESLYVGRIFVDCLHHKKGYGISLMKLVESIYPDVTEINLDTPVWNTRTNSFYKKLGYVELKQEDGFSYYQKKMT